MRCVIGINVSPPAPAKDTLAESLHYFEARASSIARRYLLKLLVRKASVFVLLRLDFTKNFP
ncbi:MAG TPA: hypothetical protein V6D37_16095 [Candidatus Sericytochromatia bacterium]